MDCTLKLPDELLAKVLSLLPMNEAIRTSLLSRRWINMWKSAEFSLLDFDYRSNSKYRRGGWFDHFETQLQKHNNPSSATRFALAAEFNQHRESGLDIDKWLEFAISNRAESLHLELTTDCSRRSDRYPFPERCLELSGIEFLKSLSLSQVDVGDEILEDIIDNCPSLEELSLKYSRTLTRIEAVGSSDSPLALKCLEVRGCRGVKSVEIEHAPFLRRLIYDGCYNCDRLEEFDVGGFSSVVDLTLVFMYYPKVTFKYLPRCGNRFNSLFLKIDPYFPIDRLGEYTRLERLAILVNACSSDSVLGSIHVINLCPRLHTLRLFFHTIYCHKQVEREVNVVKTVRVSVKVVEIVGFTGHSRQERQFVEYVMEYFVGLERIVVDRASTVGPHFSEDWFPRPKSRNSACSTQQDRDAEKFLLELKSKASPTLEFIII